MKAHVSDDFGIIANIRGVLKSQNIFNEIESDIKFINKINLIIIVISIEDILKNESYIMILHEINL